MTKKVAIITQARMSSTRLPNKIMLEIDGKPLLQYFVERLKKSGLPLYIATTTNMADDVIEKFSKEHALPYYRGSESNVLERYYLCAKENDIDVIVRITSDNPLYDGNITKEAVEEYLSLGDENVHFSNTVKRTYPHGMNFEIFSFKLLKDAYENADTDFFKEHVTPYIIQNISGNTILKHFVREEDASHFRVTVDTPEDFELIKKLIEEFGADTKGVDEIIEILRSHPELVAINADSEHHVWGDGK